MYLKGRGRYKENSDSLVYSPVHTRVEPEGMSGSLESGSTQVSSMDLRTPAAWT